MSCAPASVRDTTANALDAVTFDYWDTLVHAGDPEDAKGRRVEWVAAVLRRYELEVADVRLREAIDADCAFGSSELARRPISSTCPRRRQRSCCELLDIEAEADLLDAVIASFNGGDEPPVVEPHAQHRRDTLRALRATRACGSASCATSAWRRRRCCAVTSRRTACSICSTTGRSRTTSACYKPAPEIFEHALDGLGGVDPTRAAHVGDLRRTDVAGAQAMGMTAVRYRGSNDDPGDDGDPEGDHVIDDHADLAAVLGL